jgi:hypothetical protein
VVALSTGAFFKLAAADDVAAPTLVERCVEVLDQHLEDANGFVPMDEPGRLLRCRPSVLVRPVRDQTLKDEWMIATQQLLDLASWDLRMLYAM